MVTHRHIKICVRVQLSFCTCQDTESTDESEISYNSNIFTTVETTLLAIALPSIT